MIPAGARDAVDLGAGTGKFARLLVDRGLAVTAVDPAQEMLERLRASVPEATTVVGTAERMPLPEASADVATAAQAWHWVDDDLGFPEVARVLRPGGTLSLVWNFRDNADGWRKALAEIITDRDERLEVEQLPVARSPFAPFEYAVFGWTQTMTRAELIDLVVSRSVFIVAGAAEQRRVLAGVGELLDTHPELAGRDSYELPYRTHCLRAIVRK